MSFREVQASNEDISLLRNLMLKSTRVAEDHYANEDFIKDKYLNEFISKPWGHEYRVYIDNIYDVWKLTITPGHETSIHCHPRKDTVLLCLSGEGRFRCTYGTRDVKRGDFVHVKKGAFHSTENIGDNDLDLVEVEMPRNKFDLVRVEDNYGRASSGYESQAQDGHTLQPMIAIELGKPALLRGKDLREKYCFNVNRYGEIAQIAGVLFLINIDVELFINNRISIVKELELMPDVEREHGSFLTISCLNTDD